MDEAKIKELFADEKFALSIFEMEKAEEVQETLKEKGLSLSLEEITAIKNTLASSDNEELNDDDLENVAGGMGILAICGIIATAIGATGSLAAKTNEWTRRRW